MNSMAKAEMGRLERVELRNAWMTEAGDFTPWLAGEENLELLGKAIGLDLELEGRERNVGPFRADILCKDTATESWVLIENQLERTDHTHLGQLMTYAAGLKAVTIVWIAATFTEEHRAALDWLNEISDERFNFFGLEIELWRIGESPVAPKFNVVCKPNDWSRTVNEATGRIIDEALTDTRVLQREFWSGLQTLLLAHNGAVRPQKPLPQHWTTFAIGRTGFHLYAFLNTRDRRIGCGLVLSGSKAKPHFFLLRNERESIGQEFGNHLDWRELPERKESHILLVREEVDIFDKGTWPELQAWFARNLESFYQVFSQRVKQLDCEEYQQAGLGESV